MAYDHQGRVALVTGSTTGLGRAMALALGRSGARVAFNYAHDTARAEATLADYQAAGLEGCLVQGDVTSEAGVAGVVAEVADRLGPVEVLIPNATPDQPQLPIEEYGWDFYQSMLDFFVKSPFLLARAVLPHMKQAGWGRILNIGSEVYDRGVPNFSAYVAAKGAQRGWTRSTRDPCTSPRPASSRCWRSRVPRTPAVPAPGLCPVRTPRTACCGLQRPSTAPPA